MQANRRKWLIFFTVIVGAAVLVLADQLTKSLVFRSLKEQPPLTIIPGLLEFTYMENYAAAMGLFDGMIWLVILCTAVVCVGILAALLFYRDHTVWSCLTAALLLAGGVGNLCDRFSHGFVVDFIHVLFFPYIFNVADCCVTVGVVCFFIHYLVMGKREKAEKKSESPAEESTSGEG